MDLQSQEINKVKSKQTRVIKVITGSAGPCKSGDYMDVSDDWEKKKKKAKF